MNAFSVRLLFVCFVSVFCCFIRLRGGRERKAFHKSFSVSFLHYDDHDSTVGGSDQ